MHIKAVWGVLSLVALTLGTTMPSAATLECARTSLSSVSTCGAADRLRPTTRGQIPHTKRLKPVSEQGLPNLSDAARAGSEARSCDVSRQISKKAGNTALSKNCFMGPETTRDTLAEKAPATPLAPTSPKPQRAGIGTAFAINGSGEFLTNYHVVKSCTTAPRLRIAGEWQDGRAVVSDERNDLAVVRVQSANAVPPLRFRDGSSIRPADGTGSARQQRRSVARFQRQCNWHRVVKARHHGGGRMDGHIRVDPDAAREHQFRHQKHQCPRIPRREPHSL